MQGGKPIEEKESELEEFIDYAKIVMGMLGYKVFEPLIETKLPVSTSNSISDSFLLHLKRKIRKSGQTIEADCKRMRDGRFVVLKGSCVALDDSKTIPPGVKKARRKAKVSDDGILQEDVFFWSSSYAAAFIVGSYTNGLRAWATSEGKTLKDIKSEEEINT